MEDKHYQGLEKKFHQLQGKYLQQISTENDVACGTAVQICKSIVDKVGIMAALEMMEKFQSTNNVELITSAYFDAEDLENGDLPIPITFLNIPELYSPGQSIECVLEMEPEFTPNVTRRDWIGLFEVDWKYLHSYITFEWVSTTEQTEGKHSMLVKFNSKTLPAKPKDQAHVFCYVTRTGDVLGVSPQFHFKNPGLSFTDPDTFLVEEDMLASINIQIDMPMSLSPELEEENSLLTREGDSLTREYDHLTLNLRTTEGELEKTRADLEAKESDILELESSVAQLKGIVAAKTQQQETVEAENYTNLRSLERDLTELKIEKQQLLSLNNNLEENLTHYSDTINTQQHEIESCRKQLADSEGLLNNLQEEMFQNSVSGSDDGPLSERCRSLGQEKAALEESLETILKEKAELVNHKTTALSELHKVKMLVKSKDDVIDKLVSHKRQVDGTLVTLQSETNKHRDDSKRLLAELNSCIKQLKESEHQAYTLQKRVQQLEEDKGELAMLRNQAASHDHKVRRLEQQNRDLEQVRISLADSEIATVTVLSLQARIAHLEHINSQYESQMVQSETIVDATTSHNNVVAQLQEELDTKTRQLDSIRYRAEEIEINFREGIKDLRGQLVKKSLEIEQKNESLADKGEIIDSLRTECQGSRETERYSKHRIGQLEKKIGEEAESYHQIIADLQSQLSGYTNAHIQFDRHGLIKCPFCPAAYEREMQQLMEKHIQAKHPF